MSTLAELVHMVPAERLAVLLAAARRECLPDLTRIVAACDDRLGIEHIPPELLDYCHQAHYGYRHDRKWRP